MASGCPKKNTELYEANNNGWANLGFKAKLRATVEGPANAGDWPGYFVFPCKVNTTL